MPKKSVATLSDPTTWVEKYGDTLFRLALLRLGNKATAEDLLQETFLAALRNRHTFTSAANERTWLVSILKHKLADYFRIKGQKRQIEWKQTGNQDFQLWFTPQGNWRYPPRAWQNDPVELVQRHEFQ